MKIKGCIVNRVIDSRYREGGIHGALQCFRSNGPMTARALAPRFGTNFKIDSANTMIKNGVPGGAFFPLGLSRFVMFHFPILIEIRKLTC
jgi:hypothetical protein